MPAPPEMWQLRADLRAGADRRPGVDHRAAVDMRADIDEARHQHDAGRDVGRAAHDAARHGAEPGGLEFASRPSRRIWAHLVVPGGSPRSEFRPPGIGAMSLRRNDSSTAFFSHWLTDHLPFFFSATRSSPKFERIERRLHRLAHRPLGRGRDRLPVFPRGVDHRLKIVRVHSTLLSCFVGNCCTALADNSAPRRSSPGPRSTP